jgi:hypothetical protein
MQQNKPFEAFSFQGIKFLAVGPPQISGVHIIDEKGNNYGFWSSIEAFKKYVKRDPKFLTSLGRVDLLVWCL